MNSLYHKIISVEDDVEEWFDALLETRDFSFVMHNVECRLGKSLFDIKLWKLYLSFLENQREYRRLLETYSKYCQFFMDDEEMSEKYKKELATLGWSDVSTHEIYAFNR
uniref:Uncharacterized protein n=1 Tax=Panagrolaimus davidi TaxID=227884 RepID=A0A914P833_9BILA